ncbi:MAG: glycogen debranching enzyme, partial [Novosphingobium sp.]
MTPGVRIKDGRTRFTVRSPRAEALDLCLFEGNAEQRVAMARTGESWTVEIPRDLRGVRYGYRASGEWNPRAGLWFDPAKLLVDPHALELDGPFTHDARLSSHGSDTAGIVPKAIVTVPQAVRPHPPLFRHGGLIYELNVRGFT